MFKKFLKKTERGQAIVLIALAMVGMIAMVGLMTDTGILLIEYAKLKRGIDSASIAAAQQFRRGFTGADLATAAEQFLVFNQSTPDNIIVYRCKDIVVTDGTEHDADLCTTPRRKLLRVQASRTITFGFLRVIGINSTVITATSVGEAASIDLVFVIDTSASMAFETGGNKFQADSPLDDPSACNFSSTNPCEPLNTVKEVADQFLDTMFFPYDRVAIVALTSQTPDGTRDHITVLELNDTEADVRTAIGNLRVYQPPNCVIDTTAPIDTPSSPSSGACLFYDGFGNFLSLECPLYRHGPDLIPNTGDEVNDITSCGSSNIGGALLRAASVFTTNPMREDSFWVVITLASGGANATDGATGYPYGYCPQNTWNDTGDRNGDGDTSDVGDAPLTVDRNPPCRDAYGSTKHGNGNALYDADDYARDMADYLADPVVGQGVTVFTIGLGSDPNDNQIRHAKKGDTNGAEQLLEYVAETAGGVTANHGEYFYSPDSTGLDAIFSQIASNIFTRLSQ